MDFKIYKDNKVVAVCNHCNKELSCKRGNTSHIRSHHKTCEAKQVTAEKRNDVLRLIKVKRVCLVTLKQPLLSQRNVPNGSSYRRKALKQSKTRIFGECANSLNTKATSLTVRGLKDNIGEHVAICEGVLSKNAV